MTNEYKKQRVMRYLCPATLGEPGKGFVIYNDIAHVKFDGAWSLIISKSATIKQLCDLCAILHLDTAGMVGEGYQNITLGH